MDQQTNRNYDIALARVRRTAYNQNTQLNLEGLRLTGTQFEQLLPEIAQIPDLKRLLLGDNNLEFLPAGIGTLQNLTFLDLTRNQLRALPDEIQNVRQLESLYLIDNNFDQFPQATLRLPALTQIVLTGNQITEFPVTPDVMRRGVHVDLENNPLTLEAVIWINRNFPNGQISTDMSANEMRNDPVMVLRKIYGEGADAKIDAINAIGLGTLTARDANGRERSLPASNVLVEFLSKVPIGGVNSSEVYLPVARHLVDSILDQNQTDEDRKDNLLKVFTSLGNCATPVKAFMGQVFISMQRERGGDLSEAALNTLKVMAVELEILERLTAHIPENEEIEQVQGLVDAVFREGAENVRNNKVPISGDRIRIPSRSEYDTFEFVTPAAAEGLAKLICEEEHGLLRRNGAGQYLLDTNKLQGIIESFMAKEGLLSPREQQINEYVEAMKTYIGDHAEALLVDHNSDPGVVLGTDVEGAQKRELRALLLKVPDAEVAKTAQTYLQQKKVAVNALNELYVTSTAHGLEGMRIAGNLERNNNQRSRSKSPKPRSTGTGNTVRRRSKSSG